MAGGVVRMDYPSAMLTRPFYVLALFWRAHEVGYHRTIEVLICTGISAALAHKSSGAHPFPRNADSNLLPPDCIHGLPPILLVTSLYGLDSIIDTGPILDGLKWNCRNRLLN